MITPLNVYFKIASPKDAEKLTTVSISSFHTDFLVGGRKTMGGPSGYDSTEFHQQTIKEASKFYKIMMDDRIIGGFWFFNSNIEHAYLARIFVDPEFHRQGVGFKAFKYLFQNYPEVKRWSLQTPIWNTRTPNFYIKLGFEIIKESDKFIFFTKRMASEGKITGR